MIELIPPIFTKDLGAIRSFYHDRIDLSFFQLQKNDRFDRQNNDRIPNPALTLGGQSLWVAEMQNEMSIEFWKATDLVFCYFNCAKKARVPTSL